MSLKQDISGHESLGSTLPSLSMNTQQKTGREKRGGGLKSGGKLSINKTKTMDIISPTFPIIPQPPNPYISTLKKIPYNGGQIWKFVVAVNFNNRTWFGAEQLMSNRHQRLRRLSPETWVYLAIALLAGRFAPVHFSRGLSSDYRSAGHRKTRLRDHRLFTIWSMSDKWETENKRWRLWKQSRGPRQGFG